MTPLKRLLINTLGLACLVGCTATRTQMTSQVHRPLQSSSSLGDVAIVTVVSAEKSRPSHVKQAAEARRTLEETLRKNNAVHDVVESLQLPAMYGHDRDKADSAAFLRQACDRLRDKPVDTICLVQLKDVAGDLTLGLGFPPQRLISLGGKCDYQLQLFDVRTGQELFCSTGTWSERTDAPLGPMMPSASHFGEQVAQTISFPAATTTSPELVAERPVVPAGATTTRNR